MTARHNLIVNGVAESQTLGGYYTNRLRRTASGWKVAACALVITWEGGISRCLKKQLLLERGRVPMTGCKGSDRRTNGHEAEFATTVKRGTVASDRHPMESGQ